MGYVDRPSDSDGLPAVARNRDLDKFRKGNARLIMDTTRAADDVILNINAEDPG